MFSFENRVKVKQGWAFFLQNKWYINGRKLKIINAKFKTIKVLEDLQDLETLEYLRALLIYTETLENDLKFCTKHNP